MALLKVRPRADADLLGIWSFIARDNPVAADHVIRRINDIFTLLTQQPLSGRSREELMSGLRSFPVGSYNVFYVAKNDRVEIIRVLHAAQDLPGHFG